MIIIGICGGSCSGKTTLSMNVEKYITRHFPSLRVQVISQDCYYSNHPDLAFEERIGLDYDVPSAFDFEEMRNDIIALSEGRSIEAKHYDFGTHLRSDRHEKIFPPDILILEGIHLFYDSDLLGLMDLKIYVDVDSDICLMRRAKRDVVERSRDIAGIFRQYELTVKPAFDRYIRNYISDADITIRDGRNERAVQLIALYAANSLSGKRSSRVE